MRGVRFRFVLLLTVSVLFPLMPEEAHDADWYASEAKSALEVENYEYAVKVLKEGKKFFPDAYNLQVLLGDIYSEKELYSLAREEYEGALSRVPEDFSILYKTSQVLGKLNEEKKAVALLEKIHRLYPEDRDVISDLAWMYFKTYQLTKGEKLLKDSIEAFGSNRSFSMTLGTIYSGMYEYDLAKSYYLESIKDSAGEEGRYFASVAYYNLSLLERGFYHYNSALDYTDRSLSLADRASGHLAKGELWKARMDFDKAHEEFQRAYAIDSTPLAKVSLADLYQQW
ncbi:MAG TPA: hypothetical protein PLG43_08650, partial [Spirochaetia bacterium]|nr:hypothetical protein [Spirochaetia bacterium]